VNGEERTTPGSTSIDRTPRNKHHEWFAARVALDKYFIPRGHFKFGLLAEGVYSSQGLFENYTASVMRAPVFQPTPESRAYFLDNFRAPQYVAGGARMIVAVAKNKFDLRLEAYVFQPYKSVKRTDVDQPSYDTGINARSYLGSGSLIWQSPLGPVWFNTSYIDGLAKPWVFSANFGYVIFAQKAME
jgi:NTE family protein